MAELKDLGTSIKITVVNQLTDKFMAKNFNVVYVRENNTCYTIDPNDNDSVSCTELLSNGLLHPGTSSFNYISDRDPNDGELKNNETWLNIITGQVFVAKGGNIDTDNNLEELYRLFVTLNTEQSIPSQKAFIQPIIAPELPSEEYHLANKKYVDNVIGGLDTTVAKINMANTFTKQNTFIEVPISQTEPTQESHLVTKKYVDDAIATSLTDGEVNLQSYAKLDRENTFTNVNKFTLLPESEDIPTLETHLVNKKYTDDTYAKLNEVNIFSDVNNFLKPPTVAEFPTNDNQLVPKKYVDEAILNGALPDDVDLNDFASKTKPNIFEGPNTFNQPPETQSLPSNNFSLTNKQYVDDTIDEATTSAVEELTDFANKTFAKLKESNQFTEENIFNRLPQAYGTPTELSHITTKAYVDLAIKNAGFGGGGNIDLTGYAKLNEANTWLQKQTFNIAPTSLTQPAIDTDVVNKIYVDTSINNMQTNILTDIGNDYYTKNEADNTFILKGELTNVMNLKGVIQSKDDLPYNNNEVGDTWIVKSGTDAGFWIFTGTKFENMGSAVSIDVSNFVTTNEDQTIIGTKTFTTTPKLESAITEAYDITNKQYVDNLTSNNLKIKGEVLNYDQLVTTNSETNDIYYVNDPIDKRGYWVKTDTDWKAFTGGSLDTSDFALINSDNIFTGTNEFQVGTTTGWKLTDNSNSVIEYSSNNIIINSDITQDGDTNVKLTTIPSLNVTAKQIHTLKTRVLNIFQNGSNNPVDDLQDAFTTAGISTSISKKFIDIANDTVNYNKLNQLLALGENDINLDEFVKLNEDNTFTGINEFGTNPTVTNPVTTLTDNTLLTKKNINDMVANGELGTGGGGSIDTTNLAKLNEDNIFTAENTFNNLPLLLKDPTTNNEAVRKSYLDTSLGDKADKIDVYTKTEINTTLQDYARKSDITKVMELKGSVVNVDKLNMVVNPSIGDTYEVLLDTDAGPAGFYTFTNTGWMALSNSAIQLDTTNLALLNGDNIFTGTNVFKDDTNRIVFSIDKTNIKTNVPLLAQSPKGEDDKDSIQDNEYVTKGQLSFLVQGGGGNINIEGVAKLNEDNIFTAKNTFDTNPTVSNPATNIIDGNTLVTKSDVNKMLSGSGVNDTIDEISFSITQSGTRYKGGSMGNLTLSTNNLPVPLPSADTALTLLDDGILIPIMAGTETAYSKFVIFYMTLQHASNKIGSITKPRDFNSTNATLLLNNIAKAVGKDRNGLYPFLYNYNTTNYDDLVKNMLLDINIIWGHINVIQVDYSFTNAYLNNLRSISLFELDWPIIRKTYIDSLTGICGLLQNTANSLVNFRIKAHGNQRLHELKSICVWPKSRNNNATTMPPYVLDYSTSMKVNSMTEGVFTNFGIDNAINPSTINYFYGSNLNIEPQYLNLNETLQGFKSSLDFEINSLKVDYNIIQRLSPIISEDDPSPTFNDSYATVGQMWIKIGNNYTIDPNTNTATFDTKPQIFVCIKSDPDIGVTWWDIHREILITG